MPRSNVALDPRDPSVFTESVSPETSIQTGYDLLDGASDPRIITPQMTFGPYIGNLAQLSEKLVLVRGMSMSSVGHSSATKHALTARVPSGETVRGSSVATLMASLLGADDEIPNLAIGASSQSWSSAVGRFMSLNVSDFHAALSEGAVSLSDAQQDALYQFFDRELSGASSSRVRSMLSNREAAQLLLERDRAALFDLSARRCPIFDIWS